MNVIRIKIVKIKLWILGAGILISSAGLSFFPQFQDFQEENYVVPPFRGENFPDYVDLIIMNVYMECGKSDNFYTQFPVDGIQYCSIAQNWIFTLISLTIIGFAIMIIATGLKK